jgi:hypothetical protein
MRAPSPTFRADLATYRLSLLNEQSRTPNNNGAGRAAHAALAQAIAIVDRWKQHDKAESMWRQIVGNAPPGFAMTPIDVAARVVQYRFYADQIARGIKLAPTVERKMRARVKRYNNENTPEALAALIYESAIRLQTKDLRARNLRRGKNAPRTWFMAQWSDHFSQCFGRPLDDVVRFLTEIAFDDLNVTPDMVRNARRKIA